MAEEHEEHDEHENSEPATLHLGSPNHDDKAGKPKSKKVLFIGLGVLVAAVVFYLYERNKNSSSSSSSNGVSTAGAQPEIIYPSSGYGNGGGDEWQPTYPPAPISPPTVVHPVNNPVPVPNGTPVTTTSSTTPTTTVSTMSLPGYGAGVTQLVAKDPSLAVDEPGKIRVLDNGVPIWVNP